jgi:hypothetical protein
MKKKNLLAVAIILLTGLSSCKKSDSECELVPAKVIRYDCDRVIFQLLTTETIGDTNWVDVQTGQQYSNVVSYYNTCKIAEFTKGEKVTLFVKVKADTPVQDNLDCFRCQAISQDPPQTKVDFTEISKLSCNPSIND